MFMKDISRVMGPYYHPDDLGILSDLSAEDKDDSNDVLGEEDEEEDDTSDDKDDKNDDKDEKDEDKEDKEDSEEDNKEDDDKSDDDDKEDKEDEEESEEDEEDDDEEDKLLASWTDIKKEYPDFAKKFPEVKNALFREQEFSNIFSSPNEAKDALARVETFDQISNDIVGDGNIVDLVEHVKKTNKESYDKIIYSFLPHLQENDKDAWYDIIASPIKQLLRAAYKEGDGSKSDLGKAALHIHKFFFKDLNINDKVPSEERGVKKETKSKREQELEDRLTKIEQGKQQEFMQSVDSSYISKMTKAIQDGLDKDERLTPYMKRNITTDILREVKKILNKDTRYINTLRTLQKNAINSGLTNDFKTRIINTALVRAKSLVPEVRKRIVSEALKAEGKQKISSERAEKRERKEPRKDTNTPKKDNKPMTDLDLLRA